MAHLKEKWLSKEILNIDYCNLSSANSLTPEVLDGILKVIAKNNPQAVIFTSSHPRIFCSGGNLKTYASLSEPQTRDLNQKMRIKMKSFNDLSIYTVAYVEGDCYGGGLEFLSAFDEVYAKKHCLFGFWQKKQNLSFGWGGFQRLKRRWSDQKILKSLQNAETLLSTEALKSGLIDGIESNLEELINSISFVIKTQNYKKIKTIHAMNEEEVFESLWFSEDHLKKLK